MAKITKTTIKSFINKNFDKLYFCEKSSFDGMIDGISYFEIWGRLKVEVLAELL